MKTFLLWILGAAAAGGAAPVILVGIALLAQSKLAPIESAMTAERRLEAVRAPLAQAAPGGERVSLPIPESDAAAEIVLHPSRGTPN